MPRSKPETVICHYHVKDGKQKAFEKLLVKHWPALSKLGLVVNAHKPLHLRGEVKDGKQLYVEIFTWVSGEAAQRAHELPEVMAIWEPMGPLVAQWDFPHFEVFKPGK